MTGGTGGMKTDEPKNSLGALRKEGHDAAEERMEDWFLEGTSSEFEEGEVVRGRVVQVTSTEVLVDVGYKSEGAIPIEEFHRHGKLPRVGEEIEVYLEAKEDSEGLIVLSKDKADKIKVWDAIMQAHEKGLPVEGRIVEVVKGGVAVDVGVKAFLPGSQVDLRPVKNLAAMVGQTIRAKVIKVNRRRGNVVLSRRAVIELEPGVEGLVHVSEMSWTRRVRHPSKLVNVGDEVDVIVLDVNRAAKRISLGMKQVEPDPWATIEERYRPGTRVAGKVRNLTDFGAFIELEPGVDGLLHISDMSWTRSVRPPSENLKKGQETRTQILNIDKENKRISLGLKQIQPDPWATVAQRYPMGSRVTGKVVRLTDFGAFIELEPGVDGLLHVSQMSNRPIARPDELVSVGDELTLLVIRVDPNERRIGLSLKELAHAIEPPRPEEGPRGRRGKRGKQRDDFDDDEE